jgi:hypothetical protein
MFVKTIASVPPEVLWEALKDFSAERPALWPLIEPSTYEVHSTGEREAEVTEGTNVGPGMTMWARARYRWDDESREMTATIVESNAWEPGGVSTLRVTPAEGGGAYLEETFDRERTGVARKAMAVLAPRIFPKVFAEGRAKTYALLAERHA